MNEKKVTDLFEEAKLKMNGYAMLYHFHLANLCIKADPMALLSATIEIEGKELNLEDVATINLADERTFAITPKEPDYLFPICKAIKLEHPEFEMDQKTERNEITDEEETVIYYTMPTVNEDRRDVCMDYIKVRYETITAKMEVVFSTHTAKIVAKMIGTSAEQLEAVKEKLQEIYDWHMNLCKQFREEKEKEVEEAYQEYQKTITKQTQQAEEKDTAHGKDMMFSMNLNDEE